MSLNIKEQKATSEELKKNYAILAEDMEIVLRDL